MRCCCSDCLYTHAYRGTHVHHIPTLHSHSINLQCSKHTGTHYKAVLLSQAMVYHDQKNPQQTTVSCTWCDPLTPLLGAIDSFLKWILAAEIDLGLLKAILKMSCRVFHLFYQEISAVASRRILKVRTLIFEYAQRRHIIVCYCYILIYPYILIGFSNPEGAPSFLLFKIPGISTRTIYSTNSPSCTYVCKY